MSPLVIVILIVFVDLVGFSIVMPLLPRLADTRGYSTLQIGLIFAAYPLCQLVAGPILGRLSDRYGRRPVLAVSQAGTALSFLILGLSNSFGTMLLGRMLDGASGGNFLVAQAYVADVTKPEDRAKGLGLIGAAFGVGFVVGPLLGGFMLGLDVPEEWKLRVPFLVAAVFSSIAWVLVLWRLPESLPPAGKARQEARVLSWRGVLDTVTDPRVGGLVGVATLSTLAFAALEGTFSLFLKGRLGWGAERAAYAFALFGLVSALVQGGLIRRLVPRFGERRLMLAGFACLASGFAGIAAARGAVPVLLAVALTGFGQGLAAPSVLGLLSKVTPPSEQGAVFGTLASAQTMSRIVSYLASNILLGAFGPSAPYWAAAVISSTTIFVAAGVARRIGPVVAAAPEPLVPEVAV